MLTNYLTTFLRILMRQKIYSAINVFGLAIGIAATLLIALYITDELSYDKFHKDADRIYRVGIFVRLTGVDNPYAVTGYGTAETLKREIPSIESFLRITSRSGTALYTDTKSITMDKLIYSDSNFFNFFDFQLLSGDQKNLLKGPNKIVLTESTAHNIFNVNHIDGYKNLIGKIVLVGWNKVAMEVTGVVANPPSNSHFKFNGIVSSETDLRTQSPNHWTPDCYTYIKLSSENSIHQVESSIPAFVNKYYDLELGSITSFEDFQKRGDNVNLHLMPLLKIHLDSHQLSELEPNGNRSYLYLLAVIGAFILILVCINFINLSTARAVNRAKEVGIRKTVGAIQKKLIGQFLFESILYTLSGFILALAFVSIMIDPFNLLTAKTLSIDKLLEPVFFICMIIMLVVIAGFSGSYPAFILSSFRPSQVLKGRMSVGYMGKDIINSLVIFQFVISTTLIISSCLIYMQLNFMQTKNLGFEKDNVICLTNTLTLENSHELFRNELKSLNIIANASYSTRVISETINGNGGRRRKGSQEWHTVQAFSSDQDFAQTVGLNILSGRFFSKDFPSDQNGVVINRAAAEILGIRNLDQVEFIEYTGNDGIVASNQVIGIVENFNFEPLRSEVNPLVINLGGTLRMSIRLTPGDMQQKIKSIETIWKKYTNAPFEYSVLDQNIKAQYKSEETLGKIAIVFTGLSIVIACFGLFGLVTYMASQRTKEIGIRKIMGASVQQIVALLSKDFLRLVFIAFVIAIPISWYGMNEWLKSFAYRIDFSFMVAVIAGCAVVLIALLTVSYQSIKAAMGNPVESLRSE